MIVVVFAGQEPQICTSQGCGWALQNTCCKLTDLKMQIMVSYTVLHTEGVSFESCWIQMELRQHAEELEELQLLPSSNLQVVGKKFKDGSTCRRVSLGCRYTHFQLRKTLQPTIRPSYYTRKASSSRASLLNLAFYLSQSRTRTPPFILFGYPGRLYPSNVPRARNDPSSRISTWVLSTSLRATAHVSPLLHSLSSCLPVSDNLKQYIHRQCRRH